MIHRLIARVRNLLSSKFVRDTITLQAGALLLTAINAAAFVIVVRGLGPEQYGLYQLVLTMYGLLMTLNLTGLGPSTITRLAEAIGAADRARIRDLMGFYLQASAAVAALALLAGLLFGPAFAAASYGNPLIGQLFRVYALILVFDPLYHLVLITLQSLRAMQQYTLLENGTLLVETALRVIAVLLGYGAPGIIAATVLGALLRAAISLAVYRRHQRRQPDLLPEFGAVLGAMLRNSPRPYWRFGFLLALDKNVSALYTLLPVQVLGMLGGEVAAGFLRLGLNALSYPNMLLRGVLTNLETRLPADVGQGNYVRLEDNFRRLLRWIVPLSAGLYGVFALLAPLLMPLLGEEYIPALPVIRVLCLYGFITAVGGAFGPLYRTLRMLRAMLATKVLALALAALPGLALMRAEGPVGGAWTVNLVFVLSVGATIGLAWPRLRRLAQDQRRVGADH